MKKISVIIPIYNAEEYLEKCLDSFLKQDLNDIEIICINDSSTDKSLNILKKYKEKDNRIIIHNNHTNIGPGQSRNLALTKACGDFVFFCDADDWIPTDALGKLYNTAVEHKVLISAGSFNQYNQKEDKIIDSWPDDPRLFGRTFKKEGMLEYKDWQYDFDFTRCLYNRKFLIKNKITFPKLTYYEDPVFFVQVMTKAQRLYCIPDVVYYYRIGYKEDEGKLSEQQVKDGIDGIITNIVIARNNKLEKLENTSKDFLKHIFYNSPTFSNAIKTQEDIAHELELSKKENDQLRKKINSKSYKLIDAILLPYHKIADTIRQLRR